MIKSTYFSTETKDYATEENTTEVKIDMATAESTPSTSQQQPQEDQRVNLEFTLNDKAADQLLDTKDIYTWHSDKPVILKVAPKGPAGFRPQSVPGLLKSTVEKVPQLVAIGKSTHL